MSSSESSCGPRSRAQNEDIVARIEAGPSFAEEASQSTFLVNDSPDDMGDQKREEMGEDWLGAKEKDEMATEENGEEKEEMAAEEEGEEKKKEMATKEKGEVISRKMDPERRGHHNPLMDPDMPHFKSPSAPPSESGSKPRTPAPRERAAASETPSSRVHLNSSWKLKSSRLLCGREPQPYLLRYPYPTLPSLSQPNLPNHRQFHAMFVSFIFHNEFKLFLQQT